MRTKALKPFLLTALACCALATSSRAELINGVRAVVHDSVITYGEVESDVLMIANDLYRQYGRQPEVFQQKLDAARKDSFDKALQHQLILNDYKASGYNMPESYIEEVIQREIKSTYGDRATLTKTQSQAMESTFQALLANNLAQARVFVHRDYHSRNLMVCDPNPGILDFQDAVYGPITYDLVSLLRDAYIEWEEERVIDWCVRYWELARKSGLPVPADFADFYHDFEWMGVQRQIKVVGIFARLAFRDGKTTYLRDQALVLKYLHATCRRYRDLAGFAKLLDELDAQDPGFEPVMKN